MLLQGVPAYVGVDDEDKVATVSTLEQGYVVCPSEKRFLLLYTFLKKNLKKKVSGGRVSIIIMMIMMHDA